MAKREAGVTPRISVIIPTYNNAHYIVEALQSVFAQSFSDYEVIVVDDGSTDETTAVLTPFTDRIRLFYQENAGSAAARNTGLATARGDVVLFLDADDVLLPGKLAAQMALLDKRPSLGAVHSGWQIVDSAGELVKTIEPWRDAPRLDLAAWLKWKPVKMGAMLMRREWLLRVGGLDPALRQSHDVDLMLRLALAGCRMDWLRKPTLRYRHHAGSTMRSGAMDQARYAIMALDKFFARSDVPPAIRQRERLTRYYSLTWAAWHLYRTGFVEETAPYLRRAFAFSPYDALRTAVDWQTLFHKWSTADGHVDANLALMASCFVQAIAPADDDLFAQALCWQLEVWQPYLRGGRAVEALQAYGDWPLARLVAVAQQAIVADPERVTPQMVARYWRDLGRWQKMAVKRPFAVTPLYLTLAGQLLLRRQYGRGLAALLAALRAGYAPVAWPAWGQFLRNGAAFLAAGQGR